MKRFSSITTTQIARICGVSQGTVDRALHDRGGINKETRERILAVAREYEYTPHVGGKAIKGRSMLIGVVLFDLYNEFFSKLAMSLVQEAKQNGYSVIFLFSNKDIKQEKSAIDYFNYIGVDGIVLFSVGMDDEEYVQYLKSVMKPMVTVGNRVGDLTHIGVDDRQAMYDLSCRMLEQIKGEPVYFAPALRKHLGQGNAQTLRLQGFEQAMREHGRGYRIVTDERELSSRDCGIICSTDHYVLRALRALGVSCQSVLAGFDNLSVLRSVRDDVWTVDYSTDEIAAQCLNYFLRRSYLGVIGHRILVCSEEK